jgi:DNA-binding response OmpR family regulator
MDPRRLLLVDDDPAMHQVVEAYFASAGFEILHAHDGEEGVRMAASTTPDLILMDIQMPVMDGFRATAALRKIPECQGIPILMLSSLSQTHLKVKGLEAGADDYLIKPFDRSELHARIKAALRRNENRFTPPGAMAGDLSDLSLPELLQSLESGKKNAKVSLPEVGGEIRLSQGGLLEAAWMGFRGTEAFLRLLLLAHGRYSVAFLDPASAMEPDVMPLFLLLMDGANRFDEIENLLGTGWRLARIGLGTESGEDHEPLGEVLTGPESLPILLAKMEGDIVQSAARIRRALAAGSLVRLPDPEARP